MSTRISETFERLKKQNQGALVTFITAGDPSVEDTADLVVALAEAGADIVEMGIPYSDPLADGPVIQASSQRALDRGMTPPKTLDMVRQVRLRSQVPIVLMTSYNLVLRCGLNPFAADAAAAGADGTILTDLPPEEAADWVHASQTHGLSTVFLVAPTSTPERLATITHLATGFIYCVSRTGVTGGQMEASSEIALFLGRVRQATDKPLCVGFGISTPADVHAITRMADGAVVGSALVDFLHHHQERSEWEAALGPLVRSWKAATRHD